MSIVRTVTPTPPGVRLKLYDRGFLIDIYKGATTAAEPPSPYHQYLGSVIVPTIDLRGGWGSSTSPYPSTLWTVIGGVDDAPSWAKQLGCPLTYWSFVYRGWVYIPETGTWIVEAYFDDGIRVYIDGALVINNYTFHAPTLNATTVSLSKGFHSMKVVYFEGAGQWVCIVGLKMGDYRLTPVAVTNTDIYPAPTV
jgi:hypothetical protein